VQDFIANYAFGKNMDGKVGGSINGGLKFGGTLAEPSISGPLTLKNAFFTLPSAFDETQPGTVLEFSPFFDIQVQTDGTAKFESQAADLDLTGSGSLKGTLANLTADSTLRVRKGTLRLPTAKVTIQQGGQIRPRLEMRDWTSDARVDVQLEGKTRV